MSLARGNLRMQSDRKLHHFHLLF